MITQGLSFHPPRNRPPCRCASHDFTNDQNYSSLQRTRHLKTNNRKRCFRHKSIENGRLSAVWKKSDNHNEGKMERKASWVGYGASACVLYIWKKTKDNNSNITKRWARSTDCVYVWPDGTEPKGIFHSSLPHSEINNKNPARVSHFTTTPFLAHSFFKQTV